MIRERMVVLAFVGAMVSCINYGSGAIEVTSAAVTNSCGNDCRIFVTAITFTGNLSGVAGADGRCRNDSANPAPGRAWKAMISSAPGRRACSTPNCSINGVGENIDWALKPNAIYRRSGGTAIGTTNGHAIFTSQLENSIGATSIYVWTGLSANWQDTGMSCSAWIDNTGGVLGTVGDSLSPHSTAISTTANTCSAAAPLYCVEQ